MRAARQRAGIASGATGPGWHHSAPASLPPRGARLLALGLLRRARQLPPAPRRARAQRWAHARARAASIRPWGPDGARSAAARAHGPARLGAQRSSAHPPTARPVPLRWLPQPLPVPRCHCPPATDTARAVAHPPSAALLAGLDSTLTSGNFTVFAPTGALRRAVPHAARLRPVLTSHALPSCLPQTPPSPSCRRAPSTAC